MWQGIKDIDQLLKIASIPIIEDMVGYINRLRAEAGRTNSVDTSVDTSEDNPKGYRVDSETSDILDKYELAKSYLLAIGKLLSGEIDSTHVPVPIMLKTIHDTGFKGYQWRSQLHQLEQLIQNKIR